MRITSFIAALLAGFLLAGQADNARAGVFVSITVEPPVLPVYVQPPVPGPGYIWTPGYWAWNDGDGDGDGGGYYWVPGAWVLAPEPGLLWTPGYWGWSNGVYAWNAGYWGPHVGFYGGVSYGFGYTGAGFAGGYWAGGVYTYNRSVTNIGVNVNVNVYNKTVITNKITNVSYNGGNGGIKAQPSAGELQYANERHIPPSRDQLQQQQLAAKDPGLKAANNNGKPSIAATSKAGDFSKGNVFAAKSAGDGFKQTSPNKTQGGAAGLNKTQGGAAGLNKTQGGAAGLNKTQGGAAGLNKATGGIGNRNFNASGATGNSNVKSQTFNRQGTGFSGAGSNPSKNTNLNNTRRPGPGPSRPAQPQRPVVKQPPPKNKDNNYKKPG